VEYEGAVYHVMARGDRREAIFQDDDDRRMFMRTLGEACERTGWKVFAWVLMGNHYHLVVETPEGNLVKGMQWFQTTWTVRHNIRHGLVGHVFGGRYKAIVVETGGGDREKVWRQGGYVGAVMDYVHLNPVRAGLVTVKSRRGLLDYEWSSLKKAYTVEARKRAGWMDVKRGLDFLGFKDEASGRRKYLEYLESRMREEAAERCGAALPDGQTLQSTLQRGWCFGTQRFRDEVLERIEGAMKKRKRKKESYEGAAVRRSHGEAVAQRLVENGLEAMGLALEPEKRTRGDYRVVLLAKLVREKTTMRNEWLAARLELKSAGNVSQQLSRIGKRLTEDRGLRKTWRQLSRMAS
jgi:putative transposase